MPSNTEMFLSNPHDQKYGPWQFNEIIGYIRLHFLGTQIRGEYFSAEKKRNPVSRKKVFTFRTHKLAPEHTLWKTGDLTNQEIWEAICEYVSDCQRELMKGRYIDDSVLRELGPFIDWRSFLGWPPMDEITLRR
ncbi:hypothetical protein SAMN04488527_10291 [Aliiroseovarius crassostreae]|nr:hypothetical protein SAMN04488527_10291 [Aliiroseovarius crassostreae]